MGGGFGGGHIGGFGGGHIGGFGGAHIGGFAGGRMAGMHRDHFARRGFYDYGGGCPYYTPDSWPYSCTY
jgi:hypothetical protein